MKATINYLWRNFTEKKYENVSESTRMTSDIVFKVLNWEIIDPYISGNMPKDNTARNLSVKQLLKLQNLEIDEFEWKSILDIWWWFTGLPFVLKHVASDINIVDPIYSTDIKSEIYRNKLEVLNNIKIFDDKNYDFYTKKHYWKQEYFYTLNYEFNNILSDLNNWLSVDIKDDSFQFGVNLVNIFPITWEELSSIDEESMDYIFINHTITKNQVDPYKLLEKSDKLLKTWWKLYITESWEIDFSFIWINNHEFEVETFVTHYLTRNPKTILILKKK